MQARFRVAPMLVAAIGATFVARHHVEAQHHTRLTIAGGVGTDQRGARSSALTFAPGVVFAAKRVSLALDASATRFGNENETWSFGGGVTLAGRIPLGQLLSLTLDASAQGSQLRTTTPATFASAELQPALELNVRRVTLFGGARLATGSASEMVTASRSPLPPLGGSTATQRVTRTGTGGVMGANVAVIATPDATLRLGARQEQLRVASGDVVDRSVSASFQARGIRVSGVVGRRDASDERGAFASAALSIPLRPNVALDAGVGRYASNRLIGTPGGDYFNVGLSLRLGRSAMPTESSAVRGAPSIARGYTRFAIREPRAIRVEVAGDFNNWKPAAMRRAADGSWYADLRIAPGHYRYAFLVDGKVWRVPHGATAVDDGFGGKSAWLIVDEPGRNQ